MSEKNDNQPWWQQFAKKKHAPSTKRVPDEALSQNEIAEREAATGLPQDTGKSAKHDGDTGEKITSSRGRASSQRKRRPPRKRFQKFAHDDSQQARPTLVVAGRKSPQGMQIPTWIYDTLVVRVEGEPQDGETVAVVSQSGRFLGSAVYNSQSKIRARLFSVDNRQFDDDYVEHAIVAAWNRRRVHFTLEDSCRVVYSEADGLPGLIVDKLHDVLVVQLLTLAVERRAEAVLRTLRALFNPRTIVVRRDVQVRQREGLPVGESEVIGELSLPLQVTLDGVTYLCDPVHGQKTGLYLDQRFNRRLLIPYVAEKRVLDLFTHVGGWALVAARHGAQRVLGVDSAGQAIELARQAAEAQGLANVEFAEKDVFDFLEELRSHSSDPFDVVICDPPAFAKSHKHLQEAERAYLSLNYRAMKLLPVGGLLVTCSCSQHLSEESFELVLETAARNAHARFQIVERGGQPPDHPVLLGFSESRYLKCLFLRRVE